MMIVLYVDDLLLICNVNAVTEVRQMISARFDVVLSRPNKTFSGYGYRE